MEKNNVNEQLEMPIISLLEEITGCSLSESERIENTKELTELLLKYLKKNESPDFKLTQKIIQGIRNDLNNKAFIMGLLDQSFRPLSKEKTIGQIISLIETYNTPSFLSFFNKIKLFLFKYAGALFPSIFVPLIKKNIIEKTLFASLFKQPNEQSPNILKDVSFAKEQVISKKEASICKRLYLSQLENPQVDAISVNPSSIAFPLLPQAKKESVHLLIHQFSELLTKAKEFSPQKLVTFFAEDHTTTDLIIEAFIQTLSKEEFSSFSAGITLQSYLPISQEYLKKLIDWINTRKAPIYITLTKGSYLSWEQVLASEKGLFQAPYTSKIETDAHYKQMQHYIIEHADRNLCKVILTSHNLFDLAYSLILIFEYKRLNQFTFEILPHILPALRKILPKLLNKNIFEQTVLIEDDLHSALKYIIRRIDEGCNIDNFFRYYPEMTPHNSYFVEQETLFEESCHKIDFLIFKNRLLENTEVIKQYFAHFENEPETDFSIPSLQPWIQQCLNSIQNFPAETIPLCIEGKYITQGNQGTSCSTSDPNILYHFIIADHDDIEASIICTNQSYLSWKEVPIEKKIEIFDHSLFLLRKKKTLFIQTLMIDSSKSLIEADEEFSETIESIQYIIHQLKKIMQHSDLSWTPQGSVLIISSRSFACSDPAASITAALLCGNTVIFKPAPDTLLSAWNLAKVFWEAGIPKTVLQFLICPDLLANQKLIPDERLSLIMLSGKNETAKQLLKTNPSINLKASCEGINCMTVTSFADQELAIKDILNSAFSHSGQKISSLSYVLLEKDLFESSSFLEKLKNAAKSLKTGPIWDPTVQITPLISRPEKELLHQLKVIDKKEKWLLKPTQDSSNPHLWSPGIKLSKEPLLNHATKVYRLPLLTILCVKNLKEAIDTINSLPNSLSASLHSLNEKEQLYWLKNTQVGNCFINRNCSQYKVCKQPFGGWKQSQYALETKKGGPNFIINFMQLRQIALPPGKNALKPSIQQLHSFIENINLSAQELGIWLTSIGNYAFHWKKMEQHQDLIKVIGQDNLFGYLPKKNIHLRIEPQDSILDVFLILAAALTCDAKISLSFSSQSPHSFNWPVLKNLFLINDESFEKFIEKIEQGHIRQIRVVQKASKKLKTACGNSFATLIDSPPLSNGRFELLHFLKEHSISYNYHHYGNLGIREAEMRKPCF